MCLLQAQIWSGKSDYCKWILRVCLFLFHILFIYTNICMCIYKTFWGSVEGQNEWLPWKGQWYALLGKGTPFYILLLQKVSCLAESSCHDQLNTKEWTSGEAAMYLKSQHRCSLVCHGLCSCCASSLCLLSPLFHHCWGRGTLCKQSCFMFLPGTAPLKSLLGYV